MIFVCSLLMAFIHTGLPHCKYPHVFSPEVHGDATLDFSLILILNMFWGQGICWGHFPNFPKMSLFLGDGKGTVNHSQYILGMLDS